jgi:hypothetical protein
LSTVCGHVVSLSKCIHGSEDSYQHPLNSFQSIPEEKWALAERGQITKLVLAFPSEILPVHLEVSDAA